MGRRSSRVPARSRSSVWKRSTAYAADTLPSWNDGNAKAAIVDFVGHATTQDNPRDVSSAKRIGVFDNDGTLWSEQPMYFQLLFAMDRVKALAPQHPEWKTKEPFASLLKGDVKEVLAGGEHAIAEIVVATHSGMTTAEFDQIVRTWLATAKHPQSQRPYAEMVYQAMLEVLACLRANGFKTFIGSGGGVDFMRVFCKQVYGIPPDRVVGHTGKVSFELRNGKPALVKLLAIQCANDKAEKVAAIQQFIGRRPVMAFGNSDGDL